jgi:hypothetical protein
MCELELETGFPGGFGKSFHFAMIDVTATVEDHGTDVGSLSALGDQGADVAGAFDVGLSLLGCLVQSGRGNQSAAGNIVDDLSVNVLVGEIHSEAWATGGASYLAANALVNALPDFFAIDRTHVMKNVLE